MSTGKKHSSGQKYAIMTVRVTPDTWVLIDKLLAGGELRSHFVRTAVMNEARRRVEADKERAKQ